MALPDMPISPEHVIEPRRYDRWRLTRHGPQRARAALQHRAPQGHLAPSKTMRGSSNCCGARHGQSRDRGRRTAVRQQQSSSSTTSRSTPSTCTPPARGSQSAFFECRCRRARLPQRQRDGAPAARTARVQYERRVQQRRHLRPRQSDRRRSREGVRSLTCPLLLLLLSSPLSNPTCRHATSVPDPGEIALTSVTRHRIEIDGVVERQRKQVESELPWRLPPANTWSQRP